MTSETQQKKKSPSRISGLRFLDQFGQPPIFNIGGSDSFKTNIGVFWTLLMLATILYAGIYYFIRYVSFKNPDITAQTLQLQTVPPINLGKNKFFVSFVYRDDNRQVIIKDFQITWFIVEAFSVKLQQSGSDQQPQLSRTQIPILSCGEAGIDSQGLSGQTSIALNENASCIKFSDDVVIEGGPGSDLFQYVEVIVRACDEDDSRCKTSGIGIDDTIGTSPALKLAAKRVRVVTLQFNFFEAGVDVDDPHDPLNKNINSNYELRMDAFQEKYRTFFFQKFIVKDVRGIFSDSESSVESVTLSNVLTETTTRIPGRKDIEFVTPSGTETRSANYMTIRLQASNAEYTITRTYTKLIDVFADVGGIAEIATFIIAIMYSWHNGIRMEQNLINNGILDDEQEEVASQLGKGGFSYSEIFRFTYCCCLSRKRRRGEFFESCKETLETRLDILKFVKSRGEVGVMQAALLEPYQLKLISLGVTEKSKSGVTEKYQRSKEMSIEEALEELKRDNNKSEIGRSIDRWIRLNLDPGVKGRSSEVTSEKEKRPGSGILRQVEPMRADNSIDGGIDDQRRNRVKPNYTRVKSISISKSQLDR